MAQNGNNSRLPYHYNVFGGSSVCETRNMWWCSLTTPITDAQIQIKSAVCRAFVSFMAKSELNAPMLRPCILCDVMFAMCRARYHHIAAGIVTFFLLNT